MAALLDLLRGRRGSSPPDPAIPPKIVKRMARGREDMLRDASKRRLCIRFERGDSYWFIDSTGGLNFQATISGRRGGKPPHRVRNKYNFIRPIVTAKVSASTQRTPAFEVLPTSTDPERWSAASLGEKIALADFEKLRLHDVDVRCTYSAIGGGGEGFAWPYWDPNVGPYHDVEQSGPDGQPMLDDYDQPVTKAVGEGEIRVAILGGNEVYWEPGVAFMDSRWYAIERAVPVEDVEEMEGFFGGPIPADASTSDIPSDVRPGNLAMKVDYLERPCPSYPDGRHLTIVDKRQVVPERTYPLKGRDGIVVDEPCLHRLAWDLDGGAQRDFGLTWQLIDPQRTAQDARNKAVEWKNRALHPQWWARVNSVRSPRTDEPGVTNLYEGDTPPVQESPLPIPESLFRLADVAKADMHEIGFDTQIQADPNVAARTVQAVLSQSDAQWAQFLVGKADWWSRLMHHILLLTAANYTEPRLMKYRGRDGWENIHDFEGAQLMDEVDVRVNPASLVALTRAQVRDMLDWIVRNFPGWLNPQDALAALDTGSLDRLMASYWLDMARASTVISRIRDGSVTNMPTRGSTSPVTKQPIVDPQTGEPMPYPGYMPDEQDNLQIWERVFSDWMKTDDYASLPEPMQAIARQVWDAIQALKAAKAQREAMQQTAAAEAAGMKNAAGPPQAKPMPSPPRPAEQ